MENNVDFKIYCLTEEEKLDYIINNTTVLNGIDLNDVKQIESDFYNNVYVLLENGNLHINNTYYTNKIMEIYFLNGHDLYLITEDKKILPLKKQNEWKGLDFYLNNNNISYKKILSSPLYLTALTEQKTIVSTHADCTGVGVKFENFINVEDIIYIDEKPYIVKNNQTMPLYVM